MPGIDRNITKSFMARLRTLLKNPPAASGFGPFSVYNEDDLVAANNKSPLPNRPFVYLLDSYMVPKVPFLPMVILEIPLVRKLPFELGNRDGRTTEAIVHNFGRQRGERDDLSSLIADYFGTTFPVYQYTSGPNGDTGIFLENAEISPIIVIEDHKGALTPDVIREGSLLLWKSVRFQFLTKH